MSSCPGNGTICETRYRLLLASRYERLLQFTQSKRHVGCFRRSFWHTSKLSFWSYLKTDKTPKFNFVVEKTLDGHAHFIRTAQEQSEWSPDGRLLARGTTKELVVWDSQTGDVICKFPVKSESLALDWNNDGSKLAIGCGDIEIYNVWTKSRIGSYKLDDELRNISCIAWSADGQKLAVSLGNKTVFFRYPNRHARQNLGLPRHPMESKSNSMGKPQGYWRLAIATVNSQITLNETADGVRTEN